MRSLTRLPSVASIGKSIRTGRQSPAVPTSLAAVEPTAAGAERFLSEDCWSTGKGSVGRGTDDLMKVARSR